MYKNKKKYFILIFFTFYGLHIFCQTISGNVDQDKSMYKSLSDVDQVKKASEIAIAYVKMGKESGAQEFINEAEKKAKSLGGNSTVASTLLNISGELIKCCTANNKAMSMATKALQRTHENDKKSFLNNKIITHMKAINAATKDPLVLADLYELATDVSGSTALVTELKSNTKAEMENKQLQNITQQLSVKSEALEQKTNDLEIRSSHLENQMAAKQASIEKMSLQSVKQQLVIEYQKNMVASMKFTKAMDSLVAAKNQELLAQKQAVIDLQESKLALSAARSRTMLVILGSMLAGALSLGWFYLKTKKYNAQLNTQNRIIADEKSKSDKLLLNILPADVADELKRSGLVQPQHYDEATVLFADFVDFSSISREMTAEQLVQDLDECFRVFDQLADKYGIEKIKTIGDAYMCIGGVPITHEFSARNTVSLAMEMQAYLTTWNEKRKAKNLPQFQARIGIHTGPVAAGVVGQNKYCYDVWGDTVNIAARLESQSSAYKVNVSTVTYQKTKKDFKYDHRGKISVKNMSDLDMYYVIS
jgi:adenylate cyclase